MRDGRGGPQLGGSCARYRPMPPRALVVLAVVAAWARASDGRPLVRKPGKLLVEAPAWQVQRAAAATGRRDGKPRQPKAPRPPWIGLIQKRYIAQRAGPDRPKYDLTKVTLPWEDGGRPLASCPRDAHEEPAPAAAGAGAAVLPQGGVGPDANLQRSLSIFCAAGLGALAELYLDPRFEENDRRLRGDDGWIDRAFVTYMGARTSRSDISGEEDLLVQSIHHFSHEPVVVANFGDRVPASLTPTRFPNMVLLHGKGTHLIGKSFNFNKLTTMLFSKVKTGIVLDADQFANRGVDGLFQRAEEETTQEYPYPIMPVHWMSRDPDSSDMKGYPPEYAWHFVSKKAPKQPLRWGHAHPTWTHHALPWLANWTSFALAPERTSPPEWLKEQGPLEDEDLLNVALWSDGAMKQWCKFDIPSPKDFDDYVKQLSPSQHLFADSAYYPKGIALMFFSAHDAKHPEVSYKTLLELWEGGEARQPIVYDGKWFGSGSALREYDPSLRCMA